MRPDRQDFEGTGITARVARELEVPSVQIVVNKSPVQLDPADVSERVRAAYGVEVAAVLPHSDELMTLASEGVFVLRHPNDPLAGLYRNLAARVVPNLLPQSTADPPRAAV
jgi:MinD superfamily P-loop ATPase